MDLIVSGSRDAVLMIEGFAREMPEDKMAAALAEAHRIIKEIVALQEELAQKAEVVKAEFVPAPDDGMYDKIKAKYYGDFKTAKQTEGKQNRAAAVKALKEKVKSELIPDPAAAGAISEAAFGSAWHKLEERIVRDLILSGTRADGRDSKSLRNIECMVDVLPRVHGSAVFQRGETQALITITLGTSKDEQRVDGLFEEYSKKFMLDYYFPPFSVGEVKRLGGPGRREIGHGALAERSVKPVLPDPEQFPYTIRVMSDIFESNGSSSMASVCGATLGLMAAGVPISNPVAGISIGLVKESEQQWTLLTDIIGDEDHFGDMDFKVAGTQNGITGIQLDLKIDGISQAIIEGTLTQAREARIQILRKMLTAIPRPRTDISQSAPRLLQHQDRSGKDRRADRPGRQDDSRHSRADRRGDRSRRRRHGPRGQRRRGRREGGDGGGRIADGFRANRPNLRRPRDEYQGFRRVCGNPARQGRPVPHQRAVGRIRSQRERRGEDGRIHPGESDLDRRPGPREAEPQTGPARVGPAAGTRQWKRRRT